MKKLLSGNIRFVLLLLLAAIPVFIRVCGHDFIAYDDEVNIYANRYVTNFSLVNLWHFWEGFHHNLYIPVTYSCWSVLAAIASWFPGAAPGKLDPMVFHSANLLLHLCSIALVFKILRDLLDDDLGAFGGAMLFAIHPIQVEAVAWATGLKDVLSGFLALLATRQYFLFIGDGEPGREKIRYGLALFFFLMAILAKPAAVTLPLALGVVSCLWFKRSWRRTALELIPLVLLALPVVMVTRLAQPISEGVFIPPLWQRLLVAGDALSFYGYKLLLPLHLGPDYGRTPQMVLGHWWIYLTGTIPFLFIIAMVFKGWRRPLVYMALPLAMLLPVLGLVPFGFQEYSTVADRYVYLAMLGPALAIGWLLTSYRKSWLPIGLLTLLTLLMAVRSVIQVAVWQDGFTFYRNSLKVNPGSWFSASNLGVLYEKKGDLGEAEKLFNQALASSPGYHIAYNNLGTLKIRQGRNVEAIQYFRKALQLNPDYADPAANLGDLYMRLREVDKARLYYRQALAANPDFAHVYAALGDIAREQGELSQALVYYGDALKSGTLNSGLYNKLGVVYQESGKPQEAENMFRMALELTPDSAEAYNNLGLTLMGTGRLEEAAAEFVKAASLAPDQAMPLYNLGRISLRNGESETAREYFRRALSINPSFRPASEGLAELAETRAGVEAAGEGKGR